MGGCRCSYKNCERATKNSEKDFHFFHYPVRDPERCLKWLNNAKKPHFQTLPEDQLRNKVICQLHFEPQYFTNAFKKRLVHNAVPTVDAGSEEVVRNEDVNLQILQSDSEGNVFTVDTENLMQTEVRDVTSYVIKNGNLVPADLTNHEKIKTTNRIFKLSLGETIIDLNMENNVEEIVAKVECNREKNNKDPIINEPEHWSETNVPALPIYELDNQFVLQEEKVDSRIVAIENNSKLIETDSLEKHITSDTSSSMEVVHLSKTIQQHSKEIASLKRILRVKLKKASQKRRLTNTQIINNLRGILPATLHAAVSLHLQKKDDNFTKEERQFLTILYRTSPAAYEKLLRDCKWQLPDTETVKKLISRNCVR